MGSPMLNFAMPFPIPRWRGTVGSMAAVHDVAADEARLAERAIAGDGNAFAELYGRYEKRAYNLCLRILGSEDEAADATQDAFVNVLRRLPKLEGRELAFGSYLFTSARHACYDLIERRKRAEPTDEPPEPKNGEPGDPEDDPERRLLLEASQEEIRRANAELPERQREVLALRELEELSYDEIAEIMDMNRNSVAQLISRARINLRDALRGTALATVALSTEDCERALRAAHSEAGPGARRGRGVARPPPPGLRHLPPQPRGDGGGRPLLPLLGPGGGRAAALPRDDGSGGRDRGRRLERRGRGRARTAPPAHGSRRRADRHADAAGAPGRARREDPRRDPGQRRRSRGRGHIGGGDQGGRSQEEAAGQEGPQGEAERRSSAGLRRGRRIDRADRRGLGRLGRAGAAAAVPQDQGRPRLEDGRRPRAGRRGPDARPGAALRSPSRSPSRNQSRSPSRHRRRPATPTGARHRDPTSSSRGSDRKCARGPGRGSPVGGDRFGRGGG